MLIQVRLHHFCDHNLASLEWNNKKSPYITKLKQKESQNKALVRSASTGLGRPIANSLVDTLPVRLLCFCHLEEDLRK
jgi:hypothetical protein